MKTFLADLHIHTALSPCAMAEMTPPLIVRMAVGRGLAMIAVCDHNAAGNARAVQEAADGVLAVVAGIEIMTAEEVHILGLFPDAGAAESAAAEVLATLPMRVGRAARLERQLRLDAQGRARGEEERMLASASTLALGPAVGLIKRYGGVAVAAHVDRPSFSVLSQLGVFPSDAGLDAVEISAFSRGSPRVAWFEAWGLPVIASSDSHSPDEIGCAWSTLTAEAATFEELVLALRGEGGRRISRA